MAIIFDDFVTLLDNVQVYDRYLIASCVFHGVDVHPSMMVFKDGFFRCLSCHRHGTWQTLWNKANGQPIQVRPEVTTDWKGPVLDGAEPYDIAYVANDDLMRWSSLGWYLEMRGLSGRIEPQMLGYWNGWYTVPIFDSNREFQNLIYRSAPHIQEFSGVRYWYHGKPTLYVPDWKLVNENKYLVIVYGIFDALTLTELRIPAATPSNGKDSLRTEWLDDLRKVTYIIPDQDEEGTAMRHSKELGWRGHVVYMDWSDGCKDVNDMYVKNKKELVAQLNERIE